MMSQALIKPILKFYWQLAILKAKPEDSPYSSFLMIATGLLYALTMLMQWALLDLDLPIYFLGSLGAVVSLILSYAGFTYILLAFRNLTSRLVQTLTCLFATHTIVHLCVSPIMLFSPLMTPKNLANPVFFMFGMLYLFIILGLSIWEFLITAHIYKSALNATVMQAILAAIGLDAINILTVTLWQ